MQASKEEILAAIQKCAAEVGHAPTVMELNRAFSHINYRRVQTHFSSYTDALRAAGFDPSGPGRKTNLHELAADWARIVRAMGRVPTVREYEDRSSYSVRPLRLRFGPWNAVIRGVLNFLEKTSTAGEWDDVLGLIKGHLETPTSAVKKSTAGGLWMSTPGVMAGRQAYGAPILFPGMANAPTTEMGVVLLFGMLALSLGFVVLHAQQAFPDCEVMRQMEEDRWQRMRIEFELKSRSFLSHGHDPAGCDLVVCWEHDWPECPVEVLELKKAVNAPAFSSRGELPELPKLPKSDD